MKRYLFILGTILFLPFIYKCNRPEMSDTEFYKKHNAELREISEIYHRTTENLYYVLRINYGFFSDEVLIQPNYSDVSPIPIFNYSKDQDELKRFIEKTKMDPADLKSMIEKMKKIGCEEIYKGFYEYDSSTNNYHKTSVAIIYKENTEGLYGFGFFDLDKIYPPEAFKKLRQIDTGVYLFVTSKSVFE